MALCPVVNIHEQDKKFSHDFIITFIYMYLSFTHIHIFLSNLKVFTAITWAVTPLISPQMRRGLDCRQESRLLSAPLEQNYIF